MACSKNVHDQSSDFPLSEDINKIHFKSVSEWLLFNTDTSIFQLYHGENKLIFNEMNFAPDQHA